VRLFATSCDRLSNKTAEAGLPEATPKATVNEIVAQFLSWTKGHSSALTYEWYCQFLDSFTAL
jgi:hypothetical protein